MSSTCLTRRAVAGAESILGHAPAIAQLRETVKRVAPSSASVLVSGPSGSGKEVVARAIHEASPRAGKPFVAINCGAIPADLIESELFGHERGSFTGATSRRIGRFEEADGGTLFLDEIGDMRFDMQVKLLRVLETGLISRIGGNGAIKVDVRIVSASHRDLAKAIEDGSFREDLFFRLCVIPLATPSLAERAEDIPLLIEHFRRQAGGKPAGARFAADALHLLKQHSWPGNVRELRNVVERANALFPGETVGSAGVPVLLGCKPIARASMPTREPQTAGQPSETALPSGAMPIDLKALLETMELERIQAALDMADGVISEAARLLTLKRTTLIEKMRKYRVDKQV